MREANSVLPRRLRRPLTNIRHRNSAMTFSWVDTGRPRFILGSFNCCTTSALADAICRNPFRANTIAGDGMWCRYQSYRLDSHCELHHERVLDGSHRNLYTACKTEWTVEVVECLGRKKVRCGTVSRILWPACSTLPLAVTTAM